MASLKSLPNISKVTERNLIEAGINTSEELIKTGSREAFLRIRINDPGACLSLLYGLEGAVQGVRSSALSEETKKSLRQFHKAL